MSVAEHYCVLFVCLLGKREVLELQIRLVRNLKGCQDFSPIYTFYITELGHVEGKGGCP